MDIAGWILLCSQMRHEGVLTQHISCKPCWGSSCFLLPQIELPVVQCGGSFLPVTELVSWYQERLAPEPVPPFFFLELCLGHRCCTYHNLCYNLGQGKKACYYTVGCTVMPQNCSLSAPAKPISATSLPHLIAFLLLPI